MFDWSTFGAMLAVIAAIVLVLLLIALGGTFFYGGHPIWGTLSFVMAALTIATFAGFTT